MTGFKYVSLFSGIGGFETALNKLGGTCVMASEIDRFARQSYEALYGKESPASKLYTSRFGDSVLVGDITAVDVKDVPDHDLLVGGFPCPSFSVAGKRDGMEYECNDCGYEHLITFRDYKNGVACPECGGVTEAKDKRGLLFFEIARLVDAGQPKVVLMENVKGLISSGGGEVMRIIVQTMNEIGYTVDFDVLDSKYFGVPQHRERVFITALRDDLVSEQPWNIIGTNVVAKGKRRISALEGVKTFNFNFPEQTEVTTRLRDILETEVDEKYYLSEEKTAALVAQLGKKFSSDAGTAIQRTHSATTTVNHDLTGTLQAARVDKVPMTVEPNMLGHIDLKGHDAIKRVYDADYIAPTLTTMGGGHREPKIAELQGLPIREATKQGYAIATEGDAVNFQFPDSKTRRGRVGKQIANTLEASNINQGVVEAEVRAVLTPDRIEKRQNGRRFKENDEESFTLTAQDKHGVAIGQKPRYRIRKLTPLECMRLQSFSDEQHQTLVDAGLSNSQIYRQAGNAVTVNVITAIGERLLPYLVKDGE